MLRGRVGLRLLARLASFVLPIANGGIDDVIEEIHQRIVGHKDFDQPLVMLEFFARTGFGERTGVRYRKLFVIYLNEEGCFFDFSHNKLGF